MSTLGLAGTTEPPKPRFWRRQFTKKATVFDIVFGVVGPILCFIFDPLVFRNGMRSPLLPDLQVFVYLISGLEILLLLLWLTLRERLPAKRFLGGILIGGGIFCGVIGLVLLPFSVLGLVFGIGIFGFTPFFTALVYFRNGSQAIRSETAEFADLGRRLPVALGCLLAIATPAAISVATDLAVTTCVNAVIQGNYDHSSAPIDALSWLNPLSGSRLRRILDAYAAEPDLARKERLRKAYFEITGEDIDQAAHHRQLVD